MLSKASIAFTVPGALPGKPGQVVLVGCMHDNWRSQLCLISYSDEPEKAFSPDGRFLAVSTRAELHLISAMVGLTIARWQIPDLLRNQHVRLTPFPAHIPPVYWGMRGWQIWVRLYSTGIADTHQGAILQFAPVDLNEANGEAKDEAGAAQ